jgi:hypothetical protein
METELAGNLDYTASSNPAWATYGDPVSKKPKVN